MRIEKDVFGRYSLKIDRVTIMSGMTSIKPSEDLPFIWVGKKSEGIYGDLYDAKLDKTYRHAFIHGLQNEKVWFKIATRNKDSYSRAMALYDSSKMVCDFDGLNLFDVGFMGMTYNYKYCIVKVEDVGERFYDISAKKVIDTNIPIRSIYTTGFLKTGRFKASMSPRKDERQEAIFEFPYKQISVPFNDVCHTGSPVFMNKKAKGFTGTDDRGNTYYSEIYTDLKVKLPKDTGTQHIYSRESLFDWIFSE
jgi:hypothetical protein